MSEAIPPTVELAVFLFLVSVAAVGIGLHAWLWTVR